MAKKEAIRLDPTASLRREIARDARRRDELQEFQKQRDADRERNLEFLHAFQMTAERLADTSTWPEWLNEAAEKKPDEPYAVIGKGTGNLSIFYPEGAQAVPADAYIVSSRSGNIWFSDAEAFDAKFERVWVRRREIVTEMPE